MHDKLNNLISKLDIAICSANKYIDKSSNILIKKENKNYYIKVLDNKIFYLFFLPGIRFDQISCVIENKKDDDEVLLLKLDAPPINNNYHGFQIPNNNNPTIIEIIRKNIDYNNIEYEYNNGVLVLSAPIIHIKDIENNQRLKQNHIHLTL